MSGISQVIATINRLEGDGVIERYAIGGAVGATFYLEPVATLDVDIFVVFREEAGRTLLNLKPIFDYLTVRGGVIDGEYIVIAGWPVQFLPPTSPLVGEAMADAVTVNVEEIPARVFTAEHLAAVALQTGRPKDMARLLCSSSSPERSIWGASRASLPATASRTAGGSLSVHFCRVRNDLRLQTNA